MSTSALPSWSVVGADAARLLVRINHQLRAWGVAAHLRCPTAAPPTMWLAAMDATGRPYRTRLATRSWQTSTDRDFAEAAADDLWDAVAVSWSFVRWLLEQRLEPADHVVAELHAAGRWLADYPVWLANHDSAIASLFAGGELPAR